ncbi:MAG: hypothetical protein LBI92_02430 [Azoarcus sp.]|jgi:hypothetical protein|nr:hypothetical protein [Azoarcus sp.]
MDALLEVVKIFDTEAFQTGNGEAFQFRLEIVHNLKTNTYKGKVYRLETYRLQPTFPQTEGCPPGWKNDALIYVSDDMFDNKALSGVSIQEVVEKFQTSFDKIFVIAKKKT